MNSTKDRGSAVLACPFMLPKLCIPLAALLPLTVPVHTLVSGRSGLPRDWLRSVLYAWQGCGCYAAAWSLHPGSSPRVVVYAPGKAQTFCF